jgi:copper chaperone CopZ/outer membrane receptor protein involved in Fe transport
MAWNYGFNATHRWQWWGRDADVSFDLYRTDFQNQLMTDNISFDDAIVFSNLAGRSYANSGVVSINVQPLKGFDLRVAYKYTDVRQTFDGALLSRPLVPLHRGLVNVHYQTPDQRWRANLTLPIVGPQLLPPVFGDLQELPEYRRIGKSPAYLLLNAQVTRVLPNGWEIYAGGENLTNYTQPVPIVGYQDVSGQSSGVAKFDATGVFAPIMGAIGFVGLRYTAAEAPAYRSITINTSIQCGMCKTNIEQALRVPGVRSVVVDVDTREVTIRYHRKQLNPAALRLLINAAGYDADNSPADPSVHVNLPACCQKPSD